jgi:hypothetical protein
MASGPALEMTHISKVRLACGKRGTKGSHLGMKFFIQSQIAPIIGVDGGSHLQKPSTGNMQVCSKLKSRHN